MSVDLSKITVEEYTTPSPQTVQASESADRVMNLMSENKFRHMPVVDGARAVGIISDRDIKILQNLNQIDGRTAGDIMTPEPYSVLESDPLDKVAYEMSSRKIGSAVVNGSDGNLVGIFTSTDALNALIEIVRDNVEM